VSAVCRRAEHGLVLLVLWRSDRTRRAPLLDCSSDGSCSVAPAAWTKQCAHM
jgi:hypothetical protein